MMKDMIFLAKESYGICWWIIFGPTSRGSVHLYITADEKNTVMASVVFHNDKSGTASTASCVAETPEELYYLYQGMITELV